MGFFDFLKNKKPKTYEEVVKEIDSVNLANLDIIFNKIIKDIRNIKEALKYLQKEESQNPRAQDNIKKEFCNRALRRLDIIEKKDIKIFRSLKNKTFDDYEKFTKKLSANMDHALRISPKQLMHIKFSYGEGFSRFASANSSAIKNLSKIKKILESKDVSNLRKIRKNQEIKNKIIKQIEIQKKNIEKKQEEIEKIKNIAEIKKEKADFDIHEESYKKIRSLIDKQNEIKGNISAKILSARRLLVKYSYMKKDKFINSLLEDPYTIYTKNPIKTKKIIEEAVKTAESGKIPVSIIDIEDANKLLNYLPEFQIMIKQIAGINNDIAEERKNLEKEEKLKKRKQSLQFEFLKAEKEFEEKAKELEEMNQNLNKMESDLSALKIEIQNIRKDIIR